MSHNIGSVSVADDGTVTKSGDAGDIYDRLAQTAGSKISGGIPGGVHGVAIKRALADLANDLANAIKHPVTVQSAGVTVGTRAKLNFSSGATVTDNAGSDRLDIAVTGGGGSHTGTHYHALAAGTQTSTHADANGFRAIGGTSFDPTLVPNPGLTKTIKFAAQIEGTSGVTAEVRLYNQTDGAAVSGTTLSATSTTSTRVTSAALSLPSALKFYEVQLRIVTPSPAVDGNVATCKWAGLEVILS